MQTTITNGIPMFFSSAFKSSLYCSPWKNKHKTGQSLGNLLLNTSAGKTRESLFFFSQSVLAWDTFLSRFCPCIDQPQWTESSILTLSGGHITCQIWRKYHIFQTSGGFLVHLSITLKHRSFETVPSDIPVFSRSSSMRTAGTDILQTTSEWMNPRGHKVCTFRPVLNWCLILIIMLWFVSLIILFWQQSKDPNKSICKT